MRRLEIWLGHGRFRIPIFRHISSSSIWAGTVIRLSARRVIGWKRSSSVFRVQLSAAVAWTEAQFYIESNTARSFGAGLSSQRSMDRLSKVTLGSQSDQNRLPQTQAQEL